METHVRRRENSNASDEAKDTLYYRVPEVCGSQFCRWSREIWFKTVDPARHLIAAFLFALTVHTRCYVVYLHHAVKYAM